MKDLFAPLVLPTALTDEEKRLKEMLEKLRQLRRQNAASSSTASGIGGGGIQTAEQQKKGGVKRAADAVALSTEEVKRRVAAGAITVRKQTDRATAFRRNRRTDSSAPDDDGRSVSIDSQQNQSQTQPLLSPPIRLSFDRDVRLGSPPSNDVGANKGPTLYVRGYDLQVALLSSSFDKFGPIVRLNVDDRRKSAFITYGDTDAAERAIAEMDGNMVQGSTVRVSYARRQNQTGPARSGFSLNTPASQRKPAPAAAAAAATAATSCFDDSPPPPPPSSSSTSSVERFAKRRRPNKAEGQEQHHPHISLSVSLPTATAVPAAESASSNIGDEAEEGELSDGEETAANAQ